MDDELVVICPPSHRFAECDRIAPALLKKERFIAFDPDLPTRQFVDRHFRDSGVLLGHTIEFDNIETVKRAVEIEQGVSIVPRATVKAEIKAGTLRAIPLDPPLRRPIGILLKRNRPRTPVLREFLALLQGRAG